ncbi:MAG: signal recognition particle protein [Candidatus Bipolaricaulota bacterium]|nr:signal recognition particle protein [Candidatus Bipolaricaulota bacterium]MCS7274279.1 signal recognition particle protein [Candidatus Bipolaricaulota bacterium]MDW8111470.1 signal recognition particle protein [Candidatus Bipolaricaulota bacterium]MDW8329387.1 signal recognition particle protein [Candidatus Bipolaricaulota bacterium]
MFSALTEKLNSVLTQLRRRGALTERDLDEGLRQVRLVLLEADVHYKVVKKFIDDVKQKALGAQILESLTPGQQIVKIVRDELVQILGGTRADLHLTQWPAVILLVGLQGSGKTTMAGKLAKYLAEREQKRVLLAAADLQRPAAIEQLRQLGAKLGYPVYAQGRTPLEVAEGALQEARKSSFDVLVVDTAGRLHIDEELMSELQEMKQRLQPAETLLVVDAMTGQEAVTIAQTFDQRLKLTGIILTKLDGDARGGAALSMVTITGRPIKFVGVGEKLEDLEVFHPDRMAERILGMGDILSLIEEAEARVDAKKAEEFIKKIQRESFTLEDFREQIQQLRRMGPITKLLEKIPGMQKIEVDERALVRVEAIINSMTPEERRRPEILDAKRKRRIALGSGTHVSEVNKLLKRFDEAKKMMKQLKGKRFPQIPFGR